MSIEWCIEDQAFLLSYDLAPPPSPVSNISLFLNLPVCRRSSLLTGEGGRGVHCGGAKSKNRDKAWSSIIIQYSLGGGLQTTVKIGDLGLRLNLAWAKIGKTSERDQKRLYVYLTEPVIAFKIEDQNICLNGIFLLCYRWFYPVGFRDIFQDNSRLSEHFFWVIGGHLKPGISYLRRVLERIFRITIERKTYFLFSPWKESADLK